MAAAIQEIGGGAVVTVDKYLLQPINIKTLREHVGLPDDAIDVVTDDLGYNWYLANLIQKQTNLAGHCAPVFDFCLLDGAHEWTHDALAFYLVSKLLKPGGWIAIDDINFNLKMIPNWKETPYSQYSERELDTFQMKMVYDLVVRQHPDYDDFHLTHGGRIGWARKKPVTNNVSKRVTHFFRRWVSGI